MTEKQKKEHREELEAALEELELEEQHFGLKDSLIREVRHFLAEDDYESICDLCSHLLPVDLADLVMKLKPFRRKKLLEIIEKEINPETYSHLEKDVLRDLLDHMPPSHIASMVNHLESDDAIRIVEDLEKDKRINVLRHLNNKLRKAIEEGLTFPETSVGRMMQKGMVAVPMFWTVGKTVDYLRAARDSLPDKFYDIFIIDPMYKVVGEVSLSRLLSSKREVKISEVMVEDSVTVPAKIEQHEAVLLFRRKDLLSAAVVDDDNHLIGVITIDDVMDVMHEELEEEMLQLSGVNDTDIHREVISTANSRFIWLMVNLVTAIIASLVIGLFEGTIAQIATLAVLMPIVASMGGNAGSQTLAVTVRALANRDLSSINTIEVVIKECLVGIINGVLFSIIIGSLVYLWFGSLALGLVIATAMIINMLLAGFSGSAIPILMNKLGYDPAQSAVVFLTTVTDVIGFFAFLGLAKLVLL